MEKWLKSVVAKREVTRAFMMQNRRYSERRCILVLLRDRMRKWCEDLFDDLTLIDFEDVDYSTYRKTVKLMMTAIQKCWRDIEVSLTGVYKDVAWLQKNINVSEPIIADLWWFMVEDVNKRQQRIDDFISKFYKLHLLFQKTVSVFSEIFREQNLYLFEKYRHY